MFILKKLINSFIKKGHKQKSENMLIKSFKGLKKKKKISIDVLLNKIIKKCSSVLELRRPSNIRNKKRFPYFVKFKRNKRLTIKNFSKSVFQRLGNGFVFKLNREIEDVLVNKGFTIKKKILLYKFALKSRLFIRKFLSFQNKSKLKLRKRNRRKKKRF